MTSAHRHVIVNIPSFHLAAREGGQSVLEMRVVVGTPENKTPIFSAMMATTVFSPYWNVPESIVEGETAPAAARDPGFLDAQQHGDPARHEIRRDGRRSVNGGLGRSGRAQSTGIQTEAGSEERPGTREVPLPEPLRRLSPRHARRCVVRTRRPRLQPRLRQGRAARGARQWVSRDSPEWTDEKILEAMHAGEEQHVKLKQTIPVHIVYFTAWADDAGTVRVVPDVYGYDAIQSSH